MDIIYDNYCFKRGDTVEDLPEYFAPKMSDGDYRGSVSNIFGLRCVHAEFFAPNSILPITSSSFHLPLPEGSEVEVDAGTAFIDPLTKLLGTPTHIKGPRKYPLDVLSWYETTEVQWELSNLSVILSCHPTVVHHDHGDQIATINFYQNNYAELFARYMSENKRIEALLSDESGLEDWIVFSTNEGKPHRNIFDRFEAEEAYARRFAYRQNLVDNPSYIATKLRGDACAVWRHRDFDKVFLSCNWGTAPLDAQDLKSGRIVWNTRYPARLDGEEQLKVFDMEIIGKYQGHFIPSIVRKLQHLLLVRVPKFKMAHC